MHNLIKRPAAFLLVWLLLVLSARAQWGDYAPTGNLDDVSYYFGDYLPGQLEAIFGGFAVVAVLVTGFFLGRKWLRRVG